MWGGISLTLIAMLTLGIVTYVDAFGSDQVRVIGHRMSVDSNGILHISGIVENTRSSSIGLVRVTASLFDDNGKKLPTYDTYTLLRTIPPGYITPFHIPITDKNVGNSVSSYTLSLEWKAVEGKADKFVLTDITAFIWTHIDPNTKQLRNPHGLGTNMHHHSHAHTEIDALVKNTGDLTTRTVKVIAIWYDERGEYYSFDMQTIAKQLAPMENGRFLVMTHPTMGYYSLLAESEDYVSMRVEDGEHIFRVHEANNDNHLLPGVDTMTMTDMIVRNGENKIVDRIPVMTKPVLPQITQTDSESIPTTNDPIPVGNLVSVKVSEPIQLQSLLTNNIDIKQKFTYILQVKDSTGALVRLSWIEGNIAAKESVNTVISWTPEKEENYTVQVFLWESLKYPSAMSSNFVNSTFVAS
ncbi:MAG: FxLYD domain-containing protein [Nitrososphaerales archaeon]